ncbi:MAG TPA: PA2169 family four-helix-bundle protein [Chthoniobacterales bacterium]
MPITTTQSIATILNSLIETCKDGQEGFRLASEEVRDMTLKTVFRELSMERMEFASELQRLVEGLGETVPDTGTIGGDLHRGWIALKSVLTEGEEHAVLAECERGENSVLAEYRDALDHKELPIYIQNVVHQQYQAIKNSHDRMQDLGHNYKQV